MSSNWGKAPQEVLSRSAFPAKAKQRMSWPDPADVFKAAAFVAGYGQAGRAVDYGLDDYGLCQGDGFQRKFGKKTWSDLADRLLARLRDMKPEAGEGAFSRDYQRDHLSSEVVRALGSAGRDDEAIALCFQEAEVTGSYERLVKKLREAGRMVEAEEWIRKGVRATRDKLPSIASPEERDIRNRQQKKDWLRRALRRLITVEPENQDPENVLKSESGPRSVPWNSWKRACIRRQGRWPLPDTGFRKPEKPPGKNYISRF
jgi:hypothetical protein